MNICVSIFFWKETIIFFAFLAASSESKYYFHELVLKLLTLSPVLVMHLLLRESLPKRFYFISEV